MFESRFVGNPEDRFCCVEARVMYNQEMPQSQTNSWHHEKEILGYTWVKVFRIVPEFRILRLTFHKKSASKC